MGRIGQLPAVVPGFLPLRVALTRRGVECPVIIESVTADRATGILEGVLLAAFRSHFSSEQGSGEIPFIRILRTLDGEAQAVSLSCLIPEDRRLIIRSDQTVKKDRDPESEIKNVGLAFLISGLKYLKENNFWPERGDLIFNLDPNVSIAYRKRLGLPTYLILPGIALDSISVRDGEEFLRLSPFRFEPA